MDSTIIYVSGSIENWKDKIAKKYSPCIVVGQIPKDYTGHVIFFGMYTFNDYKRVWKHKGTATIIWCGADILYLFQRRNWWRRLWLRFITAKHVCENLRQQSMLGQRGVKWAEIKHNFFGDVNDYPVSFKPSLNPRVFIHCPKGREAEYGLDIIKRIKHKVPEVQFIVFKGNTPEEKYNEIIKNCQAGLRLNEADGFSEVLAKSLLLGQYPISTIYYPNIDWAQNEQELVRLLKELKYKTKPNPLRDWWYKELNKT